MRNVFFIHIKNIKQKIETINHLNTKTNIKQITVSKCITMQTQLALAAHNTWIYFVLLFLLNIKSPVYQNNLLTINNLIGYRKY